MTTRVVSYPLGNALARGTVGLGNGTASTSYPVANLYDGEPGIPTVLTASTRSSIDVDLNEVTNGGFETDSTSSPGTPDSWTLYSGVLARTTTAGEFYTGTAAARISSTGAGTSALTYEDVEVKAGEFRGYTFTGRGDGTGTVGLRIQDLESGNSLNSTGGWQAAATYFVTTTASTFETYSGTYTVEGFSTIRKSTTTLRLWLHYTAAAAAATGYVDDVYSWPCTDFVSVHGHDIPPSITVDLVSSSSSGFTVGSTEATAITVLQPAFYNLLSSSINARFLRLDANDTAAVSNVTIGEVVFGQTVTITAPRHTNVAAWSLAEQIPQIRQATQGGTMRALKLLEKPVRAIEIPHLCATSSDFDTYRAEIYRRTDYGTEPLILVPWDTESVVLFGRIGQQAGWDRNNPSWYLSALSVVEVPGAVVGL